MKLIWRRGQKSEILYLSSSLTFATARRLQRYGIGPFHTALIRLFYNRIMTPVRQFENFQGLEIATRYEIQR